MTRAERMKLEEALTCLMADEDGSAGGFTKGIALICELLGQRYPAYHDTRNLRSVSLEEIRARGESDFRYPGDGK